MEKETKAPLTEVASLCSRKRELTREGPLPMVADTEMKKKKGGRPPRGHPHKGEGKENLLRGDRAGGCLYTLDE